jgi:hypothetical protein
MRLRPLDTPAEGPVMQAADGAGIVEGRRTPWVVYVPGRRFRLHAKTVGLTSQLANRVWGLFLVENAPVVAIRL